jgi:ribosome-associated protein
MGMNEDNDDGLGGRSRDRREVSEANRWAGPLCALSDGALRAAPLPDVVREAVAHGRAIRSFRARARQLQRIDKLVRSLEPQQIAALDGFLAEPSEAPDPAEVAADALLTGGDEALQAWMAAHPATDRQHLRSLLRRGEGARAALIEALTTR